MSSNEENTEMKMNCNMACKSNQNLNKQMRCSSWYLLNTQNLLQYKPIKETGFLSKCVTTNFCLKLVILFLLCNSFKQVFSKSSSWLIKFSNIRHQVIQTLISRALSLQGNTSHSNQAGIASINIYYTNETPCLLFFPSFCLPNKHYTVNKWGWGEWWEISQSTICAPLPVSEDFSGGLQNLNTLGNWD